MFDITPLANRNEESIQARINQKTKPPGSLGKLETIALQLAKILGSQSIQINQPTMLVFAGDHGIAEEGVSIAPSEVTGQMVVNFLNGGAAINCFCQTNNMKIEIIDAGILSAVDDSRLTIQPLGKGTKNFAKSAAMSEQAVNEGLRLGANVVYQHTNRGTNVFGFGEMGIGNTSSAAALMASLLNFDVAECVGHGTGISDLQFVKKLSLIEAAISLHGRFSEEPKKALAAYGGFEIVQMVGAMLAAAERQSVLIIDGFISTVAALVAVKLNPDVRDYMIFAHQSAESGHVKLLEYLKAEPLLSLDLRLGEGTGAALALNLIQSAAGFYNDMASFESAGVSAV